MIAEKANEAINQTAIVPTLNEYAVLWCALNTYVPLSVVMAALHRLAGPHEVNRAWVELHASHHEIEEAVAALATVATPRQK